jgi:hypothetical protein
MNKKANSIVFILCGTLVNVLFSIICIVLLVILVAKFQPILGDTISMVLYIVALLGGWFLGMFAYQKLSKWVIAHFKLEDKLDPLFNFRSRKRKL